MKLFASIAFTVVTILSLTACGGSGGSSDTKTTFEKGQYGDIKLTSNWTIPKNSLFLDIRNDWERIQFRAKGSIGGAIYEYRNQNGGSQLNPNFVDDVIAVSDNKNKQIILICHTGSRSTAAAKLLSNNGFSNVWQIVGGMNSWRQIKPSETLVNQAL